MENVVWKEMTYMNNIKSFLGSIYLGDRFCEKVEISCNKIVFQINCISRIEEGSVEWNYYSEKDIEHGCLVFDGVVEYLIESYVTVVTSSFIS